MHFFLSTNEHEKAQTGRKGGGGRKGKLALALRDLEPNEHTEPLWAHFPSQEREKEREKERGRVVPLVIDGRQRQRAAK